jgi:site-specific DNA recombinase
MTKPDDIHGSERALPKPKRCAIYARYSSDMQRESSIEDQIRKCRDYAVKQGWIVVEEYVLYDQAISGAVFDERTSIQRLLTVAEEERPRPFDVLLIDDTSRLARNVEDQLFTIKRLGFHGVHVVSVSQGLDSSSASARMSFTLHGMMDEQFLEDLANKVRRGQEGCVLKGKYIAGGRCYGYENVPDEDPTQKGDYGRALVRGVQRRPIDEEATVVRRIFQMYVDGLSFDGIAQTLRAEEVPAPRPPRRNSVRAWSGDGIGEMLRNPIYVGQYIWKRTSTVRDPKTRRMVARPTPESEWVRSERTDWRIVDDELWNRVQERRALRRRIGVHKVGGLERTKRSQQYLFSGLLFCGLCGRAVSVIDNNDNGAKYGCGIHRYKGGCANATTIWRNRLEEQLLGWLTRDLPKSDHVEQAAKSFYATVQKQLLKQQEEARKHAVNVPELLKQRAEEKLQCCNIMEFIAKAGGRAPTSLLDDLGARDARVNRIDELLARAKEPAPMIALTTDQIKEQLREKLRDLQSVLTSSPLVGKQIIRKHIKKITLTPGDLAGKPVFHVAVDFELGGDSGVVLNGSVDASLQQYGFSTITVSGLTLDTSRARRKPTGPKHAQEGDGAEAPASPMLATDASVLTIVSDSGPKETHA